MGKSLLVMFGGLVDRRFLNDVVVYDIGMIISSICTRSRFDLGAQWRVRVPMIWVFSCICWHFMFANRVPNSVIVFLHYNVGKNVSRNATPDANKAGISSLVAHSNADHRVLRNFTFRLQYSGRTGFSPLTGCPCSR